MKKIFAILLSALMMLLCCAACAESTDASLNFNIVMSKLPEGYVYETTAKGGSLYATFTPDTDDAPIVYVSVAKSDLFEGYTFNGELTDEQTAEMIEALTADYNDASVEIIETEHGTHVIVIQENDAETDYADLITVWNGYFITIAVQKNDELTEEDMTLVNHIVSDMWIVNE